MKLRCLVFFQNIILMFCLPVSTFFKFWEQINRSQIHECWNWNKAPQFNFWEYINRIFQCVILKDTLPLHQGQCHLSPCPKDNATADRNSALVAP